MPRLEGWGRHPGHDAQVSTPAHIDAIRPLLAQGQTLARGMGRSYGDSALADHVISMRQWDRFIAFDPEQGILTCEAGVTLDDILRVMVPQGWFLSVTPGTRYVSVGGAIASDVHGKNHHRDGCFSHYLLDMDVLCGDGEIRTCSTHTHADLFHATCGGMGLTGIILRARLRLRPIRSAWMREITLRARTLDEALELFERYADATYSVAWIDCLARGTGLGRSLVMLGEHAEFGTRRAAVDSRLSIPCSLPGSLLNTQTIRAFNALYFRRVPKDVQERQVHYAPYFYPLDGIQHWNRLYGRRGFLQYQCVLPRASAREGLTQLLSLIAESGRGSFLAVLKAMGPANANLLSFPLDGYTLALDFRYDRALPSLFHTLDCCVRDHAGRLYLTKDAHMSPALFRAGYPAWEQFQEIRARYGALGRFESLQSRRLGL